MKFSTKHYGYFYLLCADFITVLGSPCSSLQQQHEGMLTVTKSPQHLAVGHSTRSMWDKLWQGAGRSEPCPACSAGTQLLSQSTDPCPQGATGDIPVQLIPPPQHPAAESWASPGGPSRRSSPDLNVRAMHKQSKRASVSVPS